MTAWIGIIGTIVGALLAGIVSWLNSRFQLRYQEARSRRLLYLTKLEETFEVLSQYARHFNVLTSNKMRSLHGEPPLKDEPPPTPISKLRMLIGFYAPELFPSLEKLEDATREWYGAVETEDIVPAWSKLNVLINDIEKELVGISKKYI